MNSEIPIITLPTPVEHKNVSGDETGHGKIYVRRMKGFFQRIRSYSLSMLLAMYFVFAWIRIDGSPLVLFDLQAQKFYLFGTVFWPQDFTPAGAGFDHLRFRTVFYHNSFRSRLVRV